MAFKVFLDANVLLDFLLRRKKYSISKELIQKIENGEFNAYITPSIVHIIAYWLCKEYDRSIAKRILLDLLDKVRVIDCDHEVTVNALMSTMNDIEDSLQYYTALHHKIDYFLTQDKNLIKSAIPSLPAYLPEDFLKITAS